MEDDSDLAQAIGRAIRSLDPAPRFAETLAQAMRLLSPVPNLIICDVRLPDGSGVALAEATVKLRPLPAVIAISGEATPEEAFQLARNGVRGYLKKPLSLPDLRQTIEHVLAEPLPLEPAVASLVGREEIQDVQSEVRQIMVTQALAMTGNDRTETATLLDAAHGHLGDESTRERGQ